MTDSESKRTEYLWDQMSVGERVEALRTELKRLDETIAASFTVEPGWSVSEGELARLRRIEEAARMLIHRIDDIGGRGCEYAIAGIRVLNLRAALDSEPKR